MLVRSSFIEPCLPSPGDRPPCGPGWIPEIKQDGYRLMARRDSLGIRLFTRNSHDWSRRYPLIVEAVNHLRVRSCLKATLASLLRGSLPGLQYNRHLAHPGDIVFQHACVMGLEGIVSKRLGSRYTSGRCRDWLKFKNPNAPAVRREAEEDWGKR
jgi:bifunctional non-homologous end joining protein LigD